MANVVVHARETVLEAEHAQFQAQLVQLNNEVESIARNERLIEMLGQRQRTLDEAGRYDAVSFDHITGTLERKRAEQEAELDQLAAGARALDYVEIASSQIRSEVREAPLMEELSSEEALSYELAPAGYSNR